MRDLPTGTVTFLFTDIEGSTRLLAELGAQGYADALAEHRRVLRAAFAAHGGVEVDTQGDAFFVAFPTAPGALAAAAEAQAALAIPVRMGIHTGTPHVSHDGYVGMDVNRAARIAAAGHGGQVLVSAATRELAGGVELRDLGEHRLKDLAAAERVYQFGGGEHAPLNSLYRTNFPVPATPFLGRANDLATVVGLLGQVEIRMLTLTGPGGTGKTRLALQAAAEVAEEFPDGMTWVSLAPLSDPTLLLTTVAQALELQQDGKRPLEDLLATSLVGQRRLLLLDNAEHLLPAIAADVARLRDINGPKLLVTSRERLQLHGEHVYAVPSLGRPDAVALFTARAAALGVSVGRADAIDTLCEQLDYLPLALELAAARTPLFTPAQLLERLGQRLDLLKGGRDADPRQQTLRATIEWSHELLTDEEQVLFRRLAVFAGGWSLEASEFVCEADVETLASLVDKSLVRRSALGRLFMLQTIRGYAYEQLQRSPDADALVRRHGRWCLSLARGFKSGAAPTDEGVAKIELERDNMRAALERAVESGEPTLALELVAALWHLWDERGRLLEGYQWANAALDQSADAPLALRMEVTMAAARFAADRGETERARALFEQVRELAEEVGDDAALASSLIQLGRRASQEGDHATARDLLERALALRRAGPDRERIGGALYMLGLALADSGEAEESLARFREAHDILAEEGSEYGTAVARQGIGWALIAGGKFAPSLTASAEGIRRMRAIGDNYAVALGLANVGTALAGLGMPEAAVRLWGAAEAIQERTGYAPAPDLPWFKLEADARSTLGDGRWERLKAEGAQLELDAAIELALELSEARGATVD